MQIILYLRIDTNELLEEHNTHTDHSPSPAVLPEQVPPTNDLTLGMCRGLLIKEKLRVALP